MDDAILRKLGNVELGEKEARCINLDDNCIHAGLSEFASSIVTLIKGGQPFHQEGFKAAMTRSWSCDAFSIQKIDDKLHHLFFAQEETVEYVLHHDPCSYENQLVLLRPWKYGVRLSL